MGGEAREVVGGEAREGVGGEGVGGEGGGSRRGEAGEGEAGEGREGMGERGRRGVGGGRQIIWEVHEILKRKEQTFFVVFIYAQSNFCKILLSLRST